MIIYCSEDDGALYRAEHIDVDPETGQAHGYLRYEIPETFTLSAEQCFGRYGAIAEILLAAKILKKT